MSSSSRRTLVDVGLLSLLALAAIVAVVDLQPLRPYVVLLAACLVPGGALMTRLRTREALTDLALAFGLSFAVEVAGSVALAWSGWWHPAALAAVLGVASTALLVSDLRRGEP